MLHVIKETNHLPIKPATSAPSSSIQNSQQIQSLYNLYTAPLTALCSTTLQAHSKSHSHNKYKPYTAIGRVQSTTHNNPPSQYHHLLQNNYHQIPQQLNHHSNYPT